ncbi:ligase [Lithospermum erythrorhizon]|uniref:4-coumarate--CoA ligase n=1 Tax=Lithospermum erythrorhizon TaxID=34254 RepID=A0AAV3PWM3_LITER
MGENLKANESQTITTPSSQAYPSWYSPKTGIYHSKHTSMNLPTEPFADVVSYIFSQKHEGENALVDSSTGVSIPYSQLYPSVKAVASGLHHMGVKQGDVVLILLPNSIIFPIIFLGVLSLGATIAPMNPVSNPLEIKKQTKDCKVKLAFTTPEKVEQLKSAGLQFPTIPVQENIIPGSIFHTIITSDPNFAPKPIINQEHAAAIMFSSGTTGACKGVVLTHKNFIAMVALFIRFEASQYKELSPSKNVYLAVLPMFHIFGLAQFVTGLLSLGTTIIVMKKFDPEEMIRAIEKFRVTHFPVVPPLMNALTKKARTLPNSSEILKSLKQVSSGAAPLTTKAIQEFVQALPHVDFIQGYGMTETTAVATRGFNTNELKNYTSVGLLAPNSEAKVVDWVSGESMPPGGVGELWLRSPGVMKCYLKNPEETINNVDKDGWLHTGDIVYFDQDGYLYVIDRLKEVIKYKGFQISPADLESVLMSHPEVVDAAVTAITDEEAGEIPVAFVVRKKGSKLSETSLMDFVATKVSPYKKVRKVCFTNVVPRSAAGKIIRRELKNILPSRL